MTGRRAIPLSLLLLFAVALAAAYLVLRSDPEPDSLASEERALVVTAESRTVTDSVPASIVPEVLPGREVYAPAWPSSVVLQSFAVPGSVLQTGSGVAVIDGVVRVAAATPRPFHRPLEFGDTGEDVAMLNDLLLALGYLDALPAAPAAYGFATDAAIASWAGDLGVPDPDGSFDPGWIAWLPSEPFAVAVVMLTVGAPAPSPGSPILRGPAEVTATAIEPANPSTPLAFEPDTAYVFVAGEERLAIDTADRAIAAADLSRVAALLPAEQTQPRVNGLVQRAEPLQVVAIPATAVQAGPSGGLCAWVPAASGYEARPLTLAGSRSGITNVLTGLAAGDEVLANPADVLEQPACPSR